MIITYGVKLRNTTAYTNSNKICFVVILLIYNQIMMYVYAK